MLKRLRLKGFKSFEDQEVDLSALTVLVGANASGKSNVLDAIRFLQGVAMDMSFVDVLRGRWEGGRRTWPGLRGGTTDLVRKGGTKFEIESDWLLGNDTVTHRIGCEVGEHPLLTHEALFSTGVHPYVFDTEADALKGKKGREGSNIRVAIKRSGKGNSVTQVLSANRSLLAQVRAQGGVAKEVAAVRDRLTFAMRSALFLDITPSRMRDYVPEGMDTLGLEGENVSALTYTICKDAEAKQDLVDWLTELCAPELIDIEFARTDLGDVMLVLVEDGKRRIPARSLSDGTLRFLGELIALRTATPGSTLLMEEIENGLHPTRAHLLVEAMEAATKARNVQVIATTHSPMVLNALSREALHRAVLVGRPPGSPGTVLKQLGQLPQFDVVCEKRGIDRLLSSGWLERAL